MTKDEALDKALYALEIEDVACRYMKDETPSQIMEAITAIKQARSAPTSAEYAMGYAEGFNDGCKPAPVQEPVADVYMAGSMKTNIGTNGRVVYVSTVYSEKPLVKGDKLYTTPPAGEKK